MFRLVIAGSRTFNDYELLKKKCDFYLSNKIKENEEIIIVSGTANGADKLGERYAQERGFKIEGYPAKWDLYGKSAGYKRNAEMVDVADAVIVFWDGKSRGTKHTIDLAQKKGVKLVVVKF